MLDFLYSLSDLSIFLLLTIATIAASMVSIICSKYIFKYQLRYKDNATIASISSLIGIIYGVLVGFIALYLIDNNDHASNAVQQEANAVANIYRDSKWLKQPTQGEIRIKLKDYIHNVVDTEWPLMRDGKDADSHGDYIIEEIVDQLKIYHVTTNSEMLIMQDLLTEMKTLYDSRHQRIIMSFAQLSPELWEVILVGTILIIGINYAFRVNFYLHLFAISAFAIMAASMLFLLVTLDRPFQGEFGIEPQAFRSVLLFIERNG